MKKPIPNSVCDDCINAECVWRAPSWGIDPPVMDCPDKKTPPSTNGDCLRSMSDEELAEWCYENASCPPGRGYPDCGVTPYNEMDNCKKCWLDWIRQEAPHGQL